MNLELPLICLTAFATSLLTFFSGFGLGTLLAPIMMFFLPVEVSIALTGVVHFFNNLFKVSLVGRDADRKILIRFGLPAVVAALLGAWLLNDLNQLQPLLTYSLWGKLCTITPIKATIGLLLVFFSLLEFLPALSRLQFGKEKLIVGGLLSGFFGGLSGNQGALRSAFLIKAGLSKEAYLGTGVIVSLFVDLTRLGVYSSQFQTANLKDHLPLVIGATLSAIIGAFTGNRLLKKITLNALQTIVAYFLLIIAAALGLGWI